MPSTEVLTKECTSQHFQTVHRKIYPSQALRSEKERKTSKALPPRRPSHAGHIRNPTHEVSCSDWNGIVIAERVFGIVFSLERTQPLEPPRLVPINRLNRLVAKGIIDIGILPAARLVAVVEHLRHLLAPRDGRVVQRGIG